MILEPEKMLKRCIDGQWNVDDFDWSKTPEVVLSKEDEMRICQYYMDMSFIERMAGDLFLGLSKRLDDPTLVAIYETFVKDELRHSHAAAKLMDYFDVHNYKVYTPNKAMLKFIPHFSKAVQTMNPAWANGAILAGELFLDIALLRGINGFVEDPMSVAVIEKVNQDESRHLAMDFYMTEYCSSHNMKRGAKSAFSLNNPQLGMLMNAPGFAAEVFLKPMKLVDPSNKQPEMVMKRLRRINMRPEVQRNPAVKQFNMVAEFLEGPIGSRVGPIVEKIISKTTGFDFSFVYAASSKNVGNDSSDLTSKVTAIDMANSIVAESAVAH